jgi:hypothetical protein
LYLALRQSACSPAPTALSVSYSCLRSICHPSSVHSHPYLSCLAILAIFPPLLSVSFRAPLSPYSPLCHSHSLKHSPWTDSISPPCCCLFLLFVLPGINRLRHAQPSPLALPEAVDPVLPCFCFPIFPIACELLRGILYSPTLPTILTFALCRLYFVFCCVSFFAIEYNLFYFLYRFSPVPGLCSFPPCCCCCPPPVANDARLINAQSLLAPSLVDRTPHSSTTISINLPLDRLSRFACTGALS